MPAKTNNKGGIATQPQRVSDLMRINPRFRKSVQIELDFNDAGSTAGYVATDFVIQSYDWIRTAFAKGSTQRAWRLTGDYGSGKSAFALTLAKSVCGKWGEVPHAFRKTSGKPLEPVFVTGEREPLHETIGKAIIKQLPGMRRKDVPSDGAGLIDLVEKAHKDSEHGIFLILDELGKNLEHAMLEPNTSDVYILQRIAELASRSGDKPFVVLAILHMGISSYTSELDVTSRREWDKVAGRFDELLFQHPFEQTVQLCAEALGLDGSKLPKDFAAESREAMKWAVESGLYGSAPTESLQAVAPRIFPLHPVALPPLMNILRRYSQNERSLFSFLAGHEQSALQDVAGLEIAKARFFRLADLYNFVRHNIAHTMTNGRATHWKIIESVVRKAEGPDQANLLKSIGVLNLIDDDDLLATRELLAKALGQGEPKKEAALVRLIDSLKEKKILFERGAVRGFALWPHTSVHLDDAFDEAKKELGEPAEPMRLVASLLEVRQIVARRHYIETGNLRHFELQFHPAKDFEKFCNSGPTPHRGPADGYVTIFLPEKAHEQTLTGLQIKNGKLHPGSNVLVGLAKPPLELLAIAKDLAAWKHVQRTIKELASDEYARRELRSQIRASEDRLNDQIDLLLGWNHNPKLVNWFLDGEPTQLEPDGLSSKLSSICESIYHDCPVITNELINRRITSSAASRARTVLIDAISKNPGVEILGMDDDKNPPEMAIYLSVLKAGNLHVQDKDGWKFVIPAKKDDHCKLRPAFAAIEKILKAHDAQRVRAPLLFDTLRAEPIGARDGLIPLVIALYLAARSSQTAVYEDSTYLSVVGGDEMQRLAKEPEHFEFQYCAIEGGRIDAYDAIAKVFKVGPKASPEVLDVVKPLMQFIAGLSEYSRNTKKLTKDATAMRGVLMAARDPASLIFRDLPAAIRISPTDGHAIGVKVSKLVLEISGSYDVLLGRLGSSITDAFSTKSSLADFRKELISRSKAIAKNLVESDLKSFVLRLGDEGLEYRKWLESLANHLAKKSAARWTDAEEELFNQRLGVFAQRMLRAEAAQADVTKKGINNGGERVVRLMLTKPGGDEHGELLHWSEDEEEKVDEIEKLISNLIDKNGRAGLSAAAKAIWNNLQKR